MKTKRINAFIFSIILFLFSRGNITAAEQPISITVSYSNAGDELQTITADFLDEWLLQPDDVYNQKLAQASFAMAAAAFRSKIYGLSERDHDILDFFDQAGFLDPRSDDYHKPTGANTIASVIAHKKIGDATLIAVSISGNNYENEWLSNLRIDNDMRAAGFNRAADMVTDRVEDYIKQNQLNGDLRLWVAGYSRAAAITNLFAADAVESHRYQGVYAYTFATPRTTKEADPHRYHSIFNIINPNDIIPLIPFPEWGFERYGIDLFLPTIETDSNWMYKVQEVNQLALSDTGSITVFNPTMNRQLHTFLDYIAFFINSSASYTETYQKILLDFWTNKDVKTLLEEIRSKISISSQLQELSDKNEEFKYQFNEFYNFLDFIVQIIYTSIMGNKFHSEDQYWDSGLSLQENIAYGHYDKSYRYWLFSTDDAEKILKRDPRYVHYTILGDVDVEIYDEKGDFIETFDHEGYFEFEPDNIRYPDFHGEISQTVIYAERLGNQTLLVLPTDQVFTVYIYSHKDQTIRISYVEHSPEKLKADVRYIYTDHYEKGEGFPEVVDPEVDRNLTAEELQEMGVLVVEPWSREIVYSPTAVMSLENAGVFHPTPTFFLVAILVLFILTLFFMIIIIKKIVRLIKKRIKKRLPQKDTPISAPNGAQEKAASAALPDPTQPPSANEDPAHSSETNKIQEQEETKC